MMMRAILTVCTLTDQATFKRLDGAAKLLTAPPKGMERTEYYEAILPHVLTVLDPVTPPNTTPVHGMHRRAAAFTIMRMFERDRKAVRESLNPILFDVLGSTHARHENTDRALRLLASAVLLAPPSPDFIQFMVAPLGFRLLTLDSFFERTPTAQITLPDQDRSLSTQRNEVHEVLHTWLRLGPTDDVTEVLRRALASACTPDGTTWHMTPKGMELAPQEYVVCLTQPQRCRRVCLEQLAPEKYLVRGPCALRRQLQ